MKFPVNLEDKIGFTQIRQLLADTCEAELAVEEARSFDITDDPDVVQRLLSETHELSQILEFEKGFEWVVPNDLRKELKRAAVPGTYLQAESFADIRDNYKAVAGVLRFFSKTRDEQYPALKAIVRDIRVFPFVLDKIDRVFNRQGGVKDSASKELARIRQTLASKNQGVSKKIQAIVEQARKAGWTDADTSASVRDGRLVVPLHATHKRKINGLIHDESATGKTVYVEPVELIEINNEIRALEIAENREIIKILIELTNDIRPYFPEILTWPAIIARFDFIRAKARVCRRWNGQLIRIAKDPVISWKGARHPLLVLSFQQHLRKVVPQDIHLDPSQRMILISGPNAGGKSVALKSVGLLQYMTQAGLLPAVEEGSVSSLFSDFFIDIGDDQSLENDLSTYSSHLHSMKHFLRHARRGSLILIDEFGTGTEPQLGAAMAQAILEKLVQSEAFGVITTHYTNLKHFAASQKGMVNAAMLYDAQNMKPLFRLETGKPGSSFAFEIARQIGLPDDILEKAQQEVGSDYIQFDKHLREISRDKRYWERKREKIRQQEKTLEKLLRDYEEHVKQFEKEKKGKIKQIQTDADLLLSQINKRIENTIQEIRKEQADKEKTRAQRQELSQFTDEARKNLTGMAGLPDQELKSLHRKHEQIRRKHLKESKEEEGHEQESAVESMGLVPGIKVRLTDGDTVGEVMQVNKKTVLVIMGELMTTIPHDQVRVISEKEFRQAAGRKTGKARSAWHDLEEKRLHFSPNVDLRGARAEDAIQRIQDLIDQAVMFDERHLRILHGKGNGVLRQVIREYLSSVDIVRQARDEDIRFGGSGITLVDLEY